MLTLFRDNSVAESILRAIHTGRTERSAGGEAPRCATLQATFAEAAPESATSPLGINPLPFTELPDLFMPAAGQERGGTPTGALRAHHRLYSRRPSTGLRERGMVLLPVASRQRPALLQGRGAYPRGESALFLLVRDGAVASGA